MPKDKALKRGVKYGAAPSTGPGFFLAIGLPIVAIGAIAFYGSKAFFSR